MKKIAMYLAAAAVVSGSVGAFAQDGPGNMIVSVPGLNLQVGAQVKDDLLAGTEKFAQGASKVTEINLDPSTMGMVGQTYGKGGEMTRKMKLMVVHTYSYDKPGMFRMEDVDAYVKKLQDGSWSCPIVSREKEKDREKFSYICTKTDSDQTNEMVILSAEPQKLSFIHMAGTMSLNELIHMSDNVHSFSREVEPHGSRFIDPQSLILQQHQLQEMNRQLSGVPGKPAQTPPPPAPTAPPAQ